MASELVHLNPFGDTSIVGECIADERHRLTYDDLRGAVHATAGRLEALGVRRGDVVATVLTNRVELVLTMYAAWTMGASLSPVNPALTDKEIAYQLTDAAVRVAVVEADTAAKVPAAVTVIDADSLFDLAPVASRDGTAPAGDEMALLVYTSGTTGRPKGVMLDHDNVSTMTTMMLRQNAFSPADRCLLILPLFHVNAIMVSVVAPLAGGGSSVIFGRFDAHAFWPAVEKERPTYFSGVPAVFFFLTILPEDLVPDTSSLRFALCGAAPMPPDAITSFEERYGVPVVEGYGLSESTVALTVNPIDGLRKPGTVGLPLEGVEIAIVDGHGAEPPAGQDGAILARGANVMRGYFHKPVETAAALKDGWLHTGDVGHLDEDGYLVLVDRVKDLIIRGGENISPSEVEAVLATHRTVMEAAVVGRPHPLMGEEPVAFVIPNPGQEVDAEALIAHCREHLASFKVPRAIFTTAELPRNAVGKVLKRPLREQVAETGEPI